MKIVITSNITKVAARYRRMARALPGIVDRALRDLVEDEAIPLFGNTVRTWQKQPTFTPQQTARGWAVKVEPILPWAYVDRGTRPHVITARNAPMLVFRYPYRAATTPNMITARAARVGNNWARKLSVHHPGNEARNFTNIIMRRMQQRAANRVRAALNEASYGAGQGL